MGYVNVEVTHNGQTETLPLYVIEGKGPSLFGRNWLEKIKVAWTDN